MFGINYMDRKTNTENGEEKLKIALSEAYALSEIDLY